MAGSHFQIWAAKTQTGIGSGQPVVRTVALSRVKLIEIRANPDFAFHATELTRLQGPPQTHDLRDGMPTPGDRYLFTLLDSNEQRRQSCPGLRNTQHRHSVNIRDRSRLQCLVPDPDIIELDWRGPRYYNAALKVAEPASIGVATIEYHELLGRLVMWDSDTDEYLGGQWAKHAVSDLLDISPDGKYVAYFSAMEEVGQAAFLAISRPPYVTPLALWPSHPCAGRAFEFVSPNLWRGGAHQVTQEELPWIRDMPKAFVLPGCPAEIVMSGAKGDPPDPLETHWLDREFKKAGPRAALERFGEAAIRVYADSHRLSKSKGMTLEAVAEIFPEARRTLRGQLHDGSSSFSNPLQCCWGPGLKLFVYDSMDLKVFSPDYPLGKLIVDLSDQTYQHSETPEEYKTWG